MRTENCRWCRFEMWALPGGYWACRRCDTVAQHDNHRAGPPKLPNTIDGWFRAPFGDIK